MLFSRYGLHYCRLTELFKFFNEGTASMLFKILSRHTISNYMELIGRIKLIRDEQQFPSGFTKREFVITTEEQYPNDIQFELLKEKGSLITAYKQGDRVKVLFDIRGREWQGKYFNSLVAWKLETADASAGGNTPPPPPPPVEAYNGPAEDDDLPF